MKMMTKRWIAPAAILLLALCALPAFAAVSIAHRILLKMSTAEPSCEVE